MQVFIHSLVVGPSYIDIDRIFDYLAKEFTAAAHIMQSSWNELSTLVSGKV